MSLAVLADHMASKGRNGDSMLVHMTPEEVHGLQALALAHGGSLTINPETGLVEASWLKKLLPAIAGMALNFIAPGIGSAIGGMLPSALGLSAATAGAIGTGIAVGGLTGLATGSLKQGIMAGLGAYGGASLAGGLSAAGAAGAQEAAISSLPAEEIANRAAQSGLTEQGYSNILAQQGTTDYLSKGAMDRFTSGVGALGSEAGRTAALQGVGGASGAMRAGFAAAGPALAEPPKTDMPSLNQYTGMVRPFTFDPYGQTYTPMEPYKAASGGIVALADGGPVLPSDIGKYTPEQKADLYNKFLSQGFADTAIRQAAGAQSDTDWQTLQNLAAQRGSPAVSGAERTVLTDPNWQSVKGQTGLEGLSSNIQNFFQTNPNVAYPAIGQEAAKYGVDTQDIIRALETGGGSRAMQTVTTSPDWRSRQGLSGLEGLSSNINMWLAERPKATEGDIRSAMETWGLNEADIKRATGKSVAELGYKAVTPTPAPMPAPAPVPTPPVGPVVPGYTGQDKTYGGDVVLDRVTPPTPGTPGKVTQANLTMQQVRDEYQKGGGSLGMPIIPFTPTPLTGGSKAAYDYLMGKGAYPTVPFTPTGEIMRPYAESVLGVPVDKTRSKMIFDPATRKYIPNPDYVAPKFPNVPGTGADGQPILRDPAGNPYTGAAASYFAANPDVKQAYETQTRGMTPEAYAAYHWNTFGKNEGRKGYADTVTPAPVGGGSQEANADIVPFARGGLSAIAAAAAARGGNVEQFNLGGYSDGGRLLRGPGDGVSDSIPATIGNKQPARLADGEFVVPARIVSEIGNGSTEAGARKLYAMMDRVQRARAKTTGKGKVAKNTRAEKYLPA